MQEYEDNEIVKEALQVYFSKYHFADGGYNDKFFKIKVGPVYIPVPNTRGRIAAVKIHDVHHLLTGYRATLKGEAEIAGWEIASGCGKYPEAWVLNFASFSYGLLFFPFALFAAFLRGRAMVTNLYHSVVYSDALLGKAIGTLRTYVGMDSPRKNSARDYVLFALWSIGSLTFTFLIIFCLCEGAIWAVSKIHR